MGYRILAAATLALLSACGGGSGGGDSGSSSGGSSSIFTLSSRSVSLSAATGGSGPISHVTLTVTNPPSSSYYYSYKWDGTAAASVAMTWTSDTTADISIQGWPPGQLGAGSFSDTVTIELCSDSACAQELAGSPATIAVSYQVTGAALPDTSFTMQAQSSYAYNLYSTDTVAALSFSVQFTHIPPNGVGLLYGASTGELIENVDFAQTSSNGDGSGTGTITLTLRQPANMAAGDYTDRFSLYLCFDSACTQYSQDSPQSIDFSYRVYATEGRDFQINELHATFADKLLYSSSARKLYLEGPLVGLADINGVVELDPATAAATGTWMTTKLVRDLAMSKDEQYIYVLLSEYDSVNAQTLWTVQRLIRNGLTADQVFSLPTTSVNDAYQIFSVAGAPSTLGVEINQSTQYSVTLYDNGVARSLGYSNSASTLRYLQLFSPSNGTHLFGVNSGDNIPELFYDFPLSSQGLGTPTTTAVSFNNGGSVPLLMLGSDDLLYSGLGEVYDPTTHAMLTPFTSDLRSVSGRMLLNTAADRAYWLSDLYSQLAVRRYVLSTRESIGVMPLRPYYALPYDAVRWGDNGLAILLSGGYLALYQGDFLAP
ncbi:MAG: hypothetical protein QM718_11815 [Steroidobacteraceae bacterium]